jgi:CO/xanthine dehydrogenase FAD-binding subunit
VEQSRDADDVLQDVDPVDDAVATADYRRRMLTLLVRRALDEVESS